jgi:hypothetical protein
MNWRRGLFRAWVLVSFIWLIVWAVTFLPGAENKINLARMSNAELIAEYCKSPPGVPPPPEGFYTDECLQRLKANDRIFEKWGGGDGYLEQGYRVAGVLNLPFLIAPPFFLFLLGVFVAWVIAGFSKIENR